MDKLPTFTALLAEVFLFLTLGLQGQAQTQPLNVAAALAGGQATVTHSAIDVGSIGNIFDGNSLSIARTAAVNPMVVTLSFATPQKLGRSRVWFQAGNNRWRVETADTLADLNSASGTYAVPLDWAANVESAWQDRAFNTPITCRVIRLKLNRLTGDNYVHLSEWQLFGEDRPPVPVLSRGRLDWTLNYRGRRDMIVTVEGASAPGGPWLPLAISTQGGPYQSSPGGSVGFADGYMTILDAFTTATAPRRFMRLRVGP